MDSLSLQQHFAQWWDVHCIAVHADMRCKGVGKALHLEYAQTRVFYERIGYSPLEVFAALWGPKLPVLQLVKRIQA